MDEKKHPMQPVTRAADGVVRFKRNAIVCYLLDSGRINMNDLAMMRFSDDDQSQFAQLIGYSVSGYGDLSYADKSIIRRADAATEKLLAEAD